MTDATEILVTIIIGCFFLTGVGLFMIKQSVGRQASQINSIVESELRRLEEMMQEAIVRHQLETEDVMNNRDARLQERIERNREELGELLYVIRVQTEETRRTFADMGAAIDRDNGEILARCNEILEILYDMKRNRN